MAAIISENLAEAIAKLVAVDVLGPLQNNLVMGQLVNRNFENALGNVGDTMNIPVAPRLVANNIAENGTITTQAATLGNVQINLSEHAEASFMVPDVTQLLTGVDIIGTYGKSAILALAERVENKLLGLTPDLTYNTALGSSTTNITEAIVDKAETALFKSKVPMTDQKYMVVTGDQYSNMRQIGRFSEVEKIGSGNAIITGDIGKIKNFYVFRSQLVASASGSAPFYNMAFASDAFALVTRRMPKPMAGQGVVCEYASAPNGLTVRVLMSYNPNSLAQQFTVDILFGAGVLRATHGVTIQSIN